MLDPLIENELVSKLPFLLSSFEKVSTILTYLKEINDIPLNIRKGNISKSDYLKLVEHIKILLDYKDSILIVSPWSLRFDLQESRFQRGYESQIDFDSPYEVYSLNHNLIYSCVNHKGIYGLSSLDKWLIQRSKNMSTYYLKYKDISGETQIKLLVVNLSSSKTLESNPYYKPKDIPEVSKILSIQNNSRNKEVVIYVLYDPPSARYNLNNIRINGEEIIIRQNNQHVISSSQPYWLLFEGPVVITQSGNTPIDRNLVIPVFYNSVYYVGINTSIESLNKSFNTSIINTATFTNEQLIINTTL